jgi:hypothetical protein
VKLAVNQAEAASMLSVSVNHFKTHVRPNLTPAYIGGATRYRVVELQKYLDLC